MQIGVPTGSGGVLLGRKTIEEKRWKELLAVCMRRKEAPARKACCPLALTCSLQRACSRSEGVGAFQQPWSSCWLWGRS
ncbi:MAG: hypothetical protein D8H93_18485 [Capnocytophaga sp.]|nr:MAG: hypothetical protein D8H93_18485 [Capnocytophaga sp.]